MSVLQLSTGILDHSSFADCSRSLTFEGCLLPTAVLRSYVITVCLHARKACSLTTKQSRALATTVSNRRDSCATRVYFISNSKNEMIAFGGSFSYLATLGRRSTNDSSLYSQSSRMKVERKGDTLSKTCKDVITSL